MKKSVRIGLIGAGRNTCRKHIPGFREIPDVELVSVCNSHPESTAQVAAKHQILRTCENWKQVVEDAGVDAIVIGTWPNLHCEITCAALEAGKHVLTEARMARNLEEARRMQSCATKHPEQIAMVVPSPFGLRHGAYIRELIDHRFLGDLREVNVAGVDDSFWDTSQFLHPRQDQNFSGKNVLSLGILHETLSRWIPRTTRVLAQATLFEPERPVEGAAELARVTVPDHLAVLSQIEGGARGIYHISAMTMFGPGHHIHLHGSEGAIKVHFDPQSDRETVQCGRLGDDHLTTLELSPEQEGRWQVEADFIAAIRGEQPVQLNDFRTALEYMAFTEAVHESWTTDKPVDVPAVE
ncbi:Gfo/Idh/MocA family protein [Rubinisphaera margarita]|uniref:Gfo/Idh/MocA family protein n=1 Tax=Rubinisphaera margarita TaxID=2909586 RepID=UPI001EE88308|nr:Gfo/Idh/MocA family oxidoreductase [Rubinisphaera margarita]MCG6157573.1 Gfo/Idh/MocA family oxidoreductase [Rubinisphaera margarita]